MTIVNHISHPVRADLWESFSPFNTLAYHLVDPDHPEKIYGNIELIRQEDLFDLNKGWVYVKHIRNETRATCDQVDRIGRVLMEWAISKILPWDAPCRDGVKLYAYETALFFYWKLGFRLDEAATADKFQFPFLKKKIKRVYAEALAKGIRPNAKNLGCHFMLLPPEALEKWKARIFFAPSFQYPDELIDQLLFENLAQTKERRIVQALQEYCS